MKKIISILGITTLGVNSLVVPIQNMNNKKETSSLKSNLRINNEQNNIEIAEQWYLKIAHEKQETIFKNNLLSAISLKDNKINFDLDKINKTLWHDNNIYKVISIPEYIKNLQLMYELGNLQFADGKPQFIEKPDFYNYDGLWTESHWYWFGYWKLHVGHVECKDFVAAMAGGYGFFLKVINGVAKWYGGVIAIISQTIATLLYANSQIMKYWDKGNGIWIGIYGLIPDLGWGSD